MKIELVAVKGRLRAKPFMLAEGQKLIIGRGAEADIQLLDTGLSRAHCALEREGDAFWLTDLGSRNGTFVNGVPATRTQLKEGDKIRLGGLEFEFRSLPERRQNDANIIAAMPELPAAMINEKVEVSQSDLMSLSKPLQSMENFRRIQRDLATIYEVGNLISGERDLKGLYDRILNAILQVVKADRAFLIVADHQKKLHPAASFESLNIPRELATSQFSSTIAEECFRSKSSVLRSNALEDERYQRAESIIAMQIHSVLCVPIQAPEKTLGVIYADTVAESAAFSRHDLELLVAIGRQAGIAIQRMQFSDMLRQQLRGAVKALVAAIEAKDEYTKGHSERVAAYALRTGGIMSLGEADMRLLELAAFLHDVGKIGIPENILRKAGPLTPQEYAIIKEHPHVGANIVSNIEGADELAEIVLHHHERWDGKGYPDGLNGDEASLLSRILVIADAFDAMSSQRPYRDKLARENVVRSIQEAAGSQFDPEIVPHFLRAAAEASADEDAAAQGAKRK